jgi:hypothetical protein
VGGSETDHPYVIQIANILGGGVYLKGFGGVGIRDWTIQILFKLQMYLITHMIISFEIKILGEGVYLKGFGGGGIRD